MSDKSERAARIDKLIDDPCLMVTVRMKRPNKSDSFDVEKNREYRKTVSEGMASMRIGFYENLEAEALKAKDSTN